MGLPELIAIVPPPQNPVEARGDWAAIQQRIGLNLPQDFKALIEVYGSGTFSDLLSPINPLREGGTGFDSVERDFLESGREFRDILPDESPWPIHPEPGGMFPWGTTDNGDTLYWLTEGEPDSWPILVRESRGPCAVVYPFGVAEFLYRWLSGSLICPIFPNWDVHTNPGFMPQRELGAATIYFSHVDGTFDERLKLLIDHFGPSCIRRRSTVIQSIFQVEPSATKVTYTEIGGGRGASLALLYPPGVESHYKEVVRQIPAQLGWPIRRISSGLEWADLVTAIEPKDPR